MHLQIRNRAITPAEAEVWFTVRTEMLNQTTEIRGRLMGPSCAYSSTIEVSYPLRALAHPPADVPLFTQRVVIPEPSLWDPVSPFLYRGPIEMWQDGQRCERVSVSHGLCSWALMAHGLRWNGKPLPLRGRSVRGLTDDNALSLRQEGINLLLAPLHETATWEIADRLGFLVIGELPQLDADVIQAAEQLIAHPSCLGWRVEHFEPEAIATIPSLSRLGTAFVVRGETQVPLLLRSEAVSGPPPVIGSMQ